MVFAEGLVTAFGAYFGFGALVALLFLILGVARLDESAKGASILFRPIIFFGCVALWPYILLRWLSGRRINQSSETPK